MKFVALVFLGAAVLSDAFAETSINGTEVKNNFSVIVNVYSKYNPTQKPDRFFQGAEVLYRHPRDHTLKRFIITAADALRDNGDNDLRIVVSRLKGYHPRVQLKYISHIIHPNFDNRTKANNIAIFLPIESPVDDIDFPTLPTPDENFEDKRTKIYSFTIPQGVDEGDFRNYKLYSMNTAVISSIWCTILYPLSPIRNTHICTSGGESRGLSQEDVGAPLVYRDAENKLKLAGTATIARPWTHQIGFPIEFTSIKPYLKWINEELEKFWL